MTKATMIGLLVANKGEKMSAEELEEFMDAGPIAGWGIYESTDREEFNIIPENDLRMHLYGDLCRCRPTKTIEDGVATFVHNSYDGREKYETGAKPN